MSVKNLRQGAGKSSYEKSIVQEDPKILEAREQDFKAYNRSLSGEGNLVDPFSTDDYSAAYGIPWDDKAIFAYMEIPVLDLERPIRLNANYENLANGLAHLENTSLPIGGESTRSVITGHRGWYGDTVFINIHLLEPGDDVYINRGFEVLHYKVRDQEIIDETDFQAIAPEPGKDMITLLSCEPIFPPPRPYRLLVNADFAGKVDKRAEFGMKESQETNQSGEVLTEDLVSESTEAEIDTISQTSTATKAQYTNMIIYGLTTVGWILVIRRLLLLGREVREYRVI